MLLARLHTHARTHTHTCTYTHRELIKSYKINMSDQTVKKKRQCKITCLEHDQYKQIYTPPANHLPRTRPVQTDLPPPQQITCLEHDQYKHIYPPQQITCLEHDQYKQIYPPPANHLPRTRPVQTDLLPPPANEPVDDDLTASCVICKRTFGSMDHMVQWERCRC